MILSALCYSFLGIFGKVALREGMRLPSMLATRFVIAAIILWSVVAALPSLRAAAARARGRRLRLVLWGVFGFAGQSALFFTALRFLSASLTEVLLYTCPAFLALLLWVRTRRRPPAPALAAVALALLGTWLVAAPAGGQASRTGVILALLAGLWYAVFLLVLARVTPGVPAVVSTAYIVSGTALAFLAALPFTGGYAPPATPAAWGAVLGLVLTATVFGFALFVVGLRRVGPLVASILSTFEPLGTLGLAAIFLGERLGPQQWAGTALILAAAFVLAARPAIDRAQAAA